jgi:hypothetical protein
MALPKIDTPTYELTLPLSKKKITFRPFLVKEQKNLMMAMEDDNKETIERNIKQVLTNCTLTQDINIEDLPVTDIEYYFINLRARSVGEIVDNKYVCTNDVGDKQCGNKMEVKINLLDIEVNINADSSNEIRINDKIVLNMKYPKFSIIEKLSKKDSAVEVAFDIMIDSIESIYDGEQYYYGYETPKEEMMQFLESLNQEQFSKLESFFENLPKIRKKVDMKCSKCGFDHTMDLEGLENFFG